MNYLLDTNIILYFLAGKIVQPLPKADILVSIITEIELLSFPALDKASENNIRNFLSEVSIIGIDTEIKDLTIKVRQQNKIKLPDAIIIATALAYDAKLLTNDNRLARIPKLKCAQLELIP